MPFPHETGDDIGQARHRRTQRPDVRLVLDRDRVRVLHEERRRERLTLRPQHFRRQRRDDDRVIGRVVEDGGAISRPSPTSCRVCLTPFVAKKLVNIATLAITHASDEGDDLDHPGAIRDRGAREDREEREAGNR